MQACAGKQPEQVEGRLQLDRVCFAYPSRASVPVFQDFSLTVEAGQTVALVGPSGSGELMHVSSAQSSYMHASDRLHCCFWLAIACDGHLWHWRAIDTGARELPGMQASPRSWR